jgi:UDP-N-acetylmuramoyl-tripeptide--D-alanyl-D-alanine ligase
VRGEAIEVAGLHQTRFVIRHSGRAWPAALPLAGSHYVMNALPAVAAALHFGIAPERIIEALEQVQPAQMRGRILEFPEGFAVIDDSYNSNPRALMQMCRLLADLPHEGRRILVAGEMLELGQTSETLHYQCGEFAAGCGIHVVVGVQGAARELARGAVDRGIPRNEVHFFTEVNPATDFISRQIRPGDLILVKGSRGVHLERMVESLQRDRGLYPISR